MEVDKADTKRLLTFQYGKNKDKLSSAKFKKTKSKDTDPANRETNARFLAAILGDMFSP